MNDNIMDGLGNLLNGQEGNFWIFQSLLVSKIETNYPIDRWVNRTVKRWVGKWGKGHVPRHIFFPFAVNLHYRVIYWDTHRDRVIYIDPLNPCTTDFEEEWVARAISLCGHMGSKWNSQQVSPPDFGMALPQLPRQVDGSSCGLYVVVYMLMLSQGWESVVFPPEGTNVFRMLVARCLGLKKFRVNQLKHTFSAKSLGEV